jgi:hypothetical protein
MQRAPSTQSTETRGYGNTRHIGRNRHGRYTQFNI